MSNTQEQRKKSRMLETIADIRIGSKINKFQFFNKSSQLWLVCNDGNWHEI